MSKDAISLLAANHRHPIPFDWGSLTWFASASQGNSDTYTLGRCVLRPGQGNPRHYHPNCAETLVVLKGQINHTGPNGELIAMTEDDTVTIPPGVWHQATNTGSGDAILLIAFSSPARETVGE